MAERKPFLVRLPRDLMAELERWAKDDLRSVNAQIEYLLRAAVRQRRRRDSGGAGEVSPRSDPGDKRQP